MASAVVFFLLTIFSSVAHGYQCGTINITSSWGFPLSPAQDCSFHIQFPPNTYVKMYLKAIDMDIYDSVGIRYPQLCRGQNTEAATFISNASYAIPFYIDVSLDPFEPSKMQLEIQIDLFPNNLGKNIQQSFSTGLNKPTGLAYLEDFQNGATYNLKTESNMGYVQAAYIGEQISQEMELWNIWVYVDGKYAYSMYDITYWTFLNPLNGSISVYIAEKPASLIGALVFNDYINYVKLYQPEAHYVPLNQRGETDNYWMSNVFPDQGMDNAVTIVGAKDGSTPFDVRQITTSNSIDNDPAYITYLAGGVVREHSNATRLYQNQLPFHVTGNLNTFYVTKGAGAVKITVSR